MEPQELQEFLDWAPTHPEPLIGSGLLYSQGKGILYGRYKTFKSMMAMNAALAIADGRPFIGFDTPEHGAKVLYLQLEMPHPLLHKRQVKLWSAWSEDNKDYRTQKQVFYWTEPFLKLNKGDGLSVLQRQITTIKPAVVIIDPIYKIMAGGLRDSDQVGALLDNLDKLIADHQVAFFLVGHTRKSAFEEEAEWGSDDLIGSVLFSAWADTIIKVSKKGGKDNKDLLQVNFDVVRNAEDVIEPKEVLFDREKLMFRSTEMVITV